LTQPLKPGKRLVDDSKVSDHHAIIPTEQPLKIADLTSDERALYDLIARRFLAVLFPSYRYEQLTVAADIAGEKFYARGKTVKDPGWRAVTSHQADSEEGREEDLPEQTLAKLEQGREYAVERIKTPKGKTKPPARYTEATLLTAMENPGKFIEDEELRESMKGSGLGTPATRAEIIEKLLHTSYIERSGKELVPTSKGKQLINLVAPELRSPELTAQWEQALTDIAKGKGSRKVFIEGIREQAVELVRSVAMDSSTYRADNISRTKCPVCGKYMLLVNGKRGKMLVCQDRTCGHRQPEKEKDFQFGSSKRAHQVNQKLIAQYSDQQSIGSNLGDLLKDALAKQKKDE
jgi:DNA topoisomerase-3